MYWGCIHRIMRKKVFKNWVRKLSKNWVIKHEKSKKKYEFIELWNKGERVAKSIYRIMKTKNKILNATRINYEKKCVGFKWFFWSIYSWLFS